MKEEFEKGKIGEDEKLDKLLEDEQDEVFLYLF
jgi:hypothetical protein